jgi:succinyl-CoA synthetase beta subunit
MYLHEYQAKQRLKQYQIAIPTGVLVTSINMARQVIADFDNAVVIKPQSLDPNITSHIITDKNDAEATITDLFYRLSRQTTRSILIERLYEIQQRIQMRILADTTTGKIKLQVSTYNDDDQLMYGEQLINILLGLREYQARDLASELNLPRQHWRHFIKTAKALYQCYVDSDAEYIDINPLGLASDNTFRAFHISFKINDYALYRHEDFLMLQSLETLSIDTLQAQQADISYQPIEGGNVSCISNGAGLGMALMDELQHLTAGEVRPAQFIDIGGMARSSQIDAALQIALRDENVKAIALAIFGGVTRCDEIAQHIVDSYSGVPPRCLIAVRLAGNNAKTGIATLEQANIPNLITTTSLKHAIEAIQKNVTNS